MMRRPPLSCIRLIITLDDEQLGFFDKSVLAEAGDVQRAVAVAARAFSDAFNGEIEEAKKRHGERLLQELGLPA